MQKRLEFLEREVAKMKSELLRSQRQESYKQGLNEQSIDVRMSLNYAALPTPSEEYRGEIFTVPGGEGAADCPYICIKDSDGKYRWYTLLTVL